MLFYDLTEIQIEKLRKSVDSKIIRKSADECWEWTGATEKGSKTHSHLYGKLKLPLTRKTVRAHRAAYFLANDEDPGGMFVMHSCDNTLCCNPNHLSLGTHEDNMFDMRQKQRTVYDPHQVGSKNRHAKLSEQDVLDIRAEWKKGKSKQNISANYPVTVANIEAIVNRRTWTHI